MKQKLPFTLALIGALTLRALAAEPPATGAQATNTPAPLTVLPPSDAKSDAPKPKLKKAKTPQPKSETATPAKLAESAVTTVIEPGPAVVKQTAVNIRGQAKIDSEVVARLQKGESVQVIEELVYKKPKKDEPPRWYRIALPTNAAVWVHSGFIDNGTKAVTPARLNLRGGPGENYSVLGRLEKGAVVKPIDTKGDWIKIEPSAAASGFVAAHLLDKQAAPAIVSTPPVTPPVTPPEVKTLPPTTAVPPTTTDVTPPPTVVPPNPVTPPVTPPATTTPPTTPPETALPPSDEPPPKRIVRREGIVAGVVSPVAPTYFELLSLHNRRAIDYLHSTNTDINIKLYKGKRVVVTGEEAIEERWAHVPVITVETIEMIP